MSDNIIETSDENFQNDVLDSEIPVLLDFWAEWCGPCKMIAPLLDQISEEYRDRVLVAKINIDHNQSTPQTYAVRSIPTLMLFKGGNVEAQRMGALSKSQLTEFLESSQSFFHESFKSFSSHDILDHFSTFSEAFN